MIPITKTVLVPVKVAFSWPIQSAIITLRWLLKKKVKRPLVPTNAPRSMPKEQ